MRKFTILVVMVAILISMGVAQAAGELDVSTAGSSGQIGVAWFYWNDPAVSTGTGNFDPFLSIDNHTYTVWEQGYNYDFDKTHPTEYDEITGGDRTHSLLLTTVPTVYIGTDPYREFRIDVNQSANGPLTLDTLRIYTSSAPLYGYDSSAWAPNLVYDMGEDYFVRMSGQTGSGSGDMRLLVPSDSFTGTYVTMYSVMGDVPWAVITDPERFASNDGFEEWGVITGEQPPPLIPEGSSILLALSSLPTVGMLGWLRRKRQSG